MDQPQGGNACIFKGNKEKTRQTEKRSASQAAILRTIPASAVHLLVEAAGILLLGNYQLVNYSARSWRLDFLNELGVIDSHIELLDFWSLTTTASYGASQQLLQPFLSHAFLL
jgi:hypothetical protein